jgi:hypothetical protein
MTSAQPPGDWHFAVSRRDFLPALVREALVTLGMLRGGEGARLCELEDLPDEQLALVRPIVNPACEILIEEDWLCGRYRGTENPRTCFSLEETENLAAFNLFSGQLSLGDIGRRLAEEMGWDEAKGFAHAKGLFLSLASKGICTPRDPPDAWD